MHSSQSLLFEKCQKKQVCRVLENEQCLQRSRDLSVVNFSRFIPRSQFTLLFPSVVDAIFEGGEYM